MTASRARGMQANPSSRADSRSIDGPDALRRLADLRELNERVLVAMQDGVRDARASGRSWAEIGAALGLSKQAVWERWHRNDLGETAAHER